MPRIFDDRLGGQAVAGQTVCQYTVGYGYSVFASIGTLGLGDGGRSVMLQSADGEFQCFTVGGNCALQGTAVTGNDIVGPVKSFQNAFLANVQNPFMNKDFSAIQAQGVTDSHIGTQYEWEFGMVNFENAQGILGTDKTERIGSGGIAMVEERGLSVTGQKRVQNSKRTLRIERCSRNVQDAADQFSTVSNYNIAINDGRVAIVDFQFAQMLMSMTEMQSDGGIVADDFNAGQRVCFQRSGISLTTAVQGQFVVVQVQHAFFEMQFARAGKIAVQTDAV